MQLTVLKSKLHRARVTGVLMDYEGSIEIDEDLLDAVGIATYEQVHIYNISNGHRFVTYAIPGKRGSGTISINGAAARLAHINDRIIIAAYGIMDSDREKPEPKVMVLDENNRAVKKKGI
ncbi:aspartate decarboxylase [Candidatus Nitromaritima sp. SCGC AAA799-C22]|nr:aspartate decarboxylase [Candidatus Nitromaritima sp. SCGC AAA799-C22]